MISLYKGESLTESGLYYFYIYGANNHNEDGISKKSYDERYNWVVDNMDKIINLDKELILKADDKFAFASFCLNLRELKKNPKFKVNTPVFLDATCGGIQHLAGLLQDLELGRIVNLKKSSTNDIPDDIYSKLLIPINKRINEFGATHKEFNHFSLINLDRKIVKQSIMTKVYNVSNYGVAKQLEDKFIPIEKETAIKMADEVKSSLKNVDGNSYFLAPGYNGNVLLSSYDIINIAEIIYDEIFIVYPSLNEIYDYFIKIADLMVALKIPLYWFTPNGLKISQHYLTVKKYENTINLFSERRKIIIRQSVDKINKKKQKEAIIPNIIHSLDADHLMKVVLNFTNKFNYSILTIHDVLVHIQIKCLIYHK